MRVSWSKAALNVVLDQAVVVAGPLVLAYAAGPHRVLAHLYNEHSRRKADPVQTRFTMDEIATLAKLPQLANLYRTQDVWRPVDVDKVEGGGRAASLEFTAMPATHWREDGYSRVNNWHRPGFRLAINADREAGPFSYHILSLDFREVKPGVFRCQHWQGCATGKKPVDSLKLMGARQTWLQPVIDGEWSETPAAARGLPAP